MLDNHQTMIDILLMEQGQVQWAADQEFFPTLLIGEVESLPVRSHRIEESNELPVIERYGLFSPENLPEEKIFHRNADECPLIKCVLL